ncbi:unnamed protein product, partial [Vitis vinifera]
ADASDLYTHKSTIIDGGKGGTFLLWWLENHLNDRIKDSLHVLDDSNSNSLTHQTQQQCGRCGSPEQGHSHFRSDPGGS